MCSGDASTHQQRMQPYCDHNPHLVGVVFKYPWCPAPNTTCCRVLCFFFPALPTDLTLKFEDPRTYDTWDSALRLLLTILTGPPPSAAPAASTDRGNGGGTFGTLSAQHGLVMAALSLQKDGSAQRQRWRRSNRSIMHLSR